MLSISHLRKTFDRVVAVDDLSLTVRRGEVFGLLGPNGAGKTTTIRTILDIIKPDAGVITFDGNPFSRAMWDQIGYLPEERGLYRKSKILSTIMYFASLKGMTETEARPRAIQWLDRFALNDSAFRKVEELSKGNQQKVQIICSLIHSPQLVIFDEPFSGLDPVNQLLLKDILLELRQQNIAIIFSTHQMEQVEKLCDEIALINTGKVVLAGSVSDVKKSHGTNSVRVEFDGDGAFLGALPNVKRSDMYPNYAELELSSISHSQAVLSAAAAKLQIKKFELVEPSLESIFVAAVGGKDTLDKAAAQKIDAAPVKPKADVSAAVKKELRGLIVSLILGPVVVLAQYARNHVVDSSMLVLWAVVIGFAGFRYLQAKKKAMAQAPGLVK